MSFFLAAKAFQPNPLSGLDTMTIIAFEGITSSSVCRFVLALLFTLITHSHHSCFDASLSGFKSVCNLHSFTGDEVFVLGHSAFNSSHHLRPTMTSGVISKVICHNNSPVLIQVKPHGANSFAYYSTLKYFRYRRKNCILNLRSSQFLRQSIAAQNRHALL